jgi:deazaflavin-dependent oxidoreductase (nitroreductase family)
MMSHNRIRAFNKRITNRITRRFASFSRGPFALVGHVGRRSGKPYETPILVEPTAEGFVIALTYGESVDWYRNVLAAGYATLRWHGRDYALGKPEPVAVQTALPLFSAFQRLILHMPGTHHFVSMQSQKRAGASPRASA